MMDNAQPLITWKEQNKNHRARWQAEKGTAPPKRVVVIDDTQTADAAYRLACEGTAMLWRGDFQNAKQLLQAMARRVDAQAARSARKRTPDLKDAFNLHRLAQSQRARTLSMLLIPFDRDYTILLHRAPDVRDACEGAWGPPAKSGPDLVASLRELLGVIGAHEWRRKGVEIAALGERVHPHYGVFAPIRSEYVDMVAETPLPKPAPALAFDIGTGTGVLAAILAKRGIKRIIATDMDPRALSCARENMIRLGLDSRIKVVEANLFPEGRAPFIVCNPPWLPARPSSALERAVYDPDSQMLRGFLAGLAAHLEPDGEGWLILSDLAEHLGLRTREVLLEWISAAGLIVAERIDVRPTHPRAADKSDPLHAARAKEITSLWRLKAA
ncbi:MAG: class I SAM-dependent methyltransferase [Betaproteobacteria bacterium]|nr:class I SAM-dependent methyltransferase [Betaproteobacteria bacterium]